MTRTPTHPSRPRRRDQRGQALSAFVAVVLSALFGVAGLVVDGGAKAGGRAEAEAGGSPLSGAAGPADEGGAKSAARAEAEAVASHAARAAVDASAFARATGSTLDVGATTAAGQQVLADRGITGQVTITDGVVRVTTTTSARTVFLSLVGISELSASGEATAVLERWAGRVSAGWTPSAWPPR